MNLPLLSIKSCHSMLRSHTMGEMVSCKQATTCTIAILITIGVLKASYTLGYISTSDMVFCYVHLWVLECIWKCADKYTCYNFSSIDYESIDKGLLHLNRYVVSKHQLIHHFQHIWTTNLYKTLAIIKSSDEYERSAKLQH
jgi:hypothetical protein